MPNKPTVFAAADRLFAEYAAAMAQAETGGQQHRNLFMELYDAIGELLAEEGEDAALLDRRLRGYALLNLLRDRQPPSKLLLDEDDL